MREGKPTKAEGIVYRGKIRKREMQSLKNISALLVTHSHLDYVGGAAKAKKGFWF